MFDGETSATSLGTTQRITHLENVMLYRQNDIWVPLPDWALFYLKVGATVAAYVPHGHRIITGIAAPTRAYAASLSCVGAVVGLAATHLVADQLPIDKIAKFQELSPGTPLIDRRTSNKQERCALVGIKYDAGVPYVHVKPQSKLVRRLPPNLLHGLEPLENSEFVPSEHSAGRRIISDGEFEFIKAHVGSRPAGELIAYSRLDCLIVGPRNAAQRELGDTQFAVQAPRSAAIDGSLNLLARNRSILGPCAAYRSDVFSPSSEDTASWDNSLLPCVTIFNGALGFLKWRHLFKGTHWIVILDRTEPRFSEAVSEFNNHYFIRRADVAPQVDLPSIPPGVENLWYLEECANELGYYRRNRANL